LKERLSSSELDDELQLISSAILGGFGKDVLDCCGLLVTGNTSFVSDGRPSSLLSSLFEELSLTKLILSCTLRRSLSTSSGETVLLSSGSLGVLLGTGSSLRGLLLGEETLLEGGMLVLDVDHSSFPR